MDNDQKKPVTATPMPATPTTPTVTATPQPAVTATPGAPVVATPVSAQTSVSATPATPAATPVAPAGTPAAAAQPQVARPQTPAGYPAGTATYNAAAQPYTAQRPPTAQPYVAQQPAAPRPANYPYQQGAPYTNTPAQPSTQGKSKKTLSTGAIIALCAILSLVMGLVGAVVGNKLFPPTLEIPEDATLPLFFTVEPGQNLADLEVDSFANVADATKVSVVEIFVRIPVSDGVMEGAGSGVILSEDGYIVTNAHVIEGGRTIKVALHNGDLYDAELIGSDTKNDLAMIKIDATGLIPALMGDSDTLRVGDRVLAIGNPLGELGGSVTEGIISALDREVIVEGNNMRLLQISAGINPGNSGGGLFNMRGELVGVVNAKSVGVDVEGLGFAIPINTAKTVINSMLGGDLQGRPEIGMEVLTIADESTAYKYGVTDYGVYVIHVTTGGPAGNAGIREMDRITSINGTEIRLSSDVSTIVGNSAAGDVLTIEVVRGGTTMTFEVTLRASA